MSKERQIVENLANLGLFIEEMGNECFLCGYQPMTNDIYPHYDWESCLIFEAMLLINPGKFPCLALTNKKIGEKQ